MSRQGREFERMVTRIEQSLVPTGAIVKSPDYVKDRITKGLREVDASIRFKIGAASILITIECRDRSKIDDATWIEQLATKKQNIGAALTIAVSSRGFSKPAIEKARFYGIEIRTTSKLRPEDVLDWLRVQQVEVRVDEWSLEKVWIELYDVSDSAELDEQIQESFGKDRQEALIFIRNSDQKEFSVRNILIEWEKRNGSVFLNVPSDGTVQRRTLHQPLERGGLHTLTNEGPFDTKCIHLRLALQRKLEFIPMSRLVGYSNEMEPLVQSAEWDLEQGWVVSLHRDLGTGEIRIGLSQ